MQLPNYVLQAIRRLEDAGYPSYAVGGCVRDLLLGNMPKDYDLCTAAVPEQILTVFNNELTVPTGLVHGTVTVWLEGNPLEITSFRSETGYADSRHPDQVQFGVSLEDDLARRDFTVNAIAFHPIRGLIDPFHGETDLRARKIRAVGRPDCRFSEDGLRILRMFRFAAQLEFDIVPDTLSGAVRALDRLQHISGERIFMEWMKLTSAQNPSEVLQIMDRIGALTAMFPELVSQDNRKDIYQAFAYTPADTKLRTAMLFWNLPIQAKQALLRLHADKRTISAVTQLAAMGNLSVPSGEREIRYWMSRYPIDQIQRFLEIQKAFGAPTADAAIEHLHQALYSGSCYQIKDLAINGQDLLLLGIPEGKQVGEILYALLQEVLDEPQKNTHSVLVARAAELILANKKAGGTE